MGKILLNPNATKEEYEEFKKFEQNLKRLPKKHISRKTTDEIYKLLTGEERQLIEEIKGNEEIKENENN